jgi:hypothetical protein
VIRHRFVFSASLPPRPWSITIRPSIIVAERLDRSRHPSHARSACDSTACTLAYNSSASAQLSLVPPIHDPAFHCRQLRTAVPACLLSSPKFTALLSTLVEGDLIPHRGIGATAGILVFPTDHSVVSSRRSRARTACTASAQRHKCNFDAACGNAVILRLWYADTPVASPNDRNVHQDYVAW